jgi:hypothetical protein
MADATLLSSLDPTRRMITSPKSGEYINGLHCLRIASYSAAWACPDVLASSANFWRAAIMEGGSRNLMGAAANCLTWARVASTFPEVDCAFKESRSSFKLLICAES